MHLYYAKKTNGTYPSPQENVWTESVSATPDLYDFNYHTDISFTRFNRALAVSIDDHSSGKKDTMTDILRACQ